METQIFEEYLKDRYEKQLKWYGNQSFRNQRCYQRLQWLTIVLSVLVPVLVVGRHYGPEWFTRILAVGLAMAIMALKTFKFQENWVNYRTIVEALLRCRST